MTSREDLIEKARAAIKPSDSIDLVRAFEYLAGEQAHAPTPVEREPAHATNHEIRRGEHG